VPLLRRFQDAAHCQRHGLVSCHDQVSTVCGEALLAHEVAKSSIYLQYTPIRTILIYKHTMFGAKGPANEPR
jgi:hypothetical protein